MQRDAIFNTRTTPVALCASRQLFLDDYLVAEQQGLTRRMHMPTTRGPVLRPDAAAGEQALQSRSVPQWNPEKSCFEWWYWGGWKCEPWGRWHSTSKMLTQYATSTDGVHWEKPDLGRFEWKGSKHNNIVLDPALGHRALYHILRDDHDVDPARRYKALLGTHDRKVVVSSDGFDFVPLDVPDITSSDESHFFFDEQTSTFVALVKRGSVWGRSVHLTTTKDFVTWEDHGLVMHADGVDWENKMRRIRAAAEDDRYVTPAIIDEEDYMAETYQMAAMPYEGLYVGFVGIFNPAGAIPPPQTNHTGLNQAELTMSRDLRRWKRLCDRQVFLGVGPFDEATYDWAQVLPCGRPLIHDDEIWIYYNACRFRGHREIYPERYAQYFDDNTALCLATLRLDGFVSLDADEAGSLITRRVTLGSGDLQVNMESPAGSIRAALLDADSGQPLEGAGLDDCLPASGDNLRAPITFRGGKAAGQIAAGKPVHVQLEMQGAKLYALWST